MLHKVLRSTTFTFPPAESPDNIISLISTGAGIFVDNGSPAGVLPDNSIVRGGTINFQCRSGSLDTGVGQLVDLDGNTFNIGQNNGVFSVASIGNPVQPGSIRIQTGTDLTAADEGVYTCRIPDETGNDVDVNIGVYLNGFNSESVRLPVMLYSIGSMYAHLLALISYLLNVRTNLIKPRKDNNLSWPSNLIVCQACICLL